MPQTRWAVFLRATLASALAVILVAALGGTARAQEPWTITPEGLGPIALGSTIDAVRDALPDPYVLGDEVPIAPDLQGHVVSVDGTVHVLIPSTERGTVETVIVLDQSYQTPEGIGPRSLIGDGEDIYGDVRLQWSEEDQGREQVLFANGPSGLSFRASEAVGPQAGIYGDDQTRTVLYDPSSRLTSIWIIGDEDASGADAPAAASDEEPAEADESQDNGDDEPVDEEEDPGDSEEPAEEPESAEEPGAEDAESGAEEESGTEEPADEPAPEADNAGSGTLPNIDDELPQTGVETTTVTLAGVATVFVGLGIGRIGRRKRPWS